MSQRFDILIIGSGIAALSTALAAGDARVAVITPGTLGVDGASCMAQGGIAAALGTEDSAAAHARDTFGAGQWRNLEAAVARLTAGARAAIAWLEAQGVAFDRDGRGAYALGHEAAHSAQRIVHAGGDATGAAVMRALAYSVRRAPHVTVFENCAAQALIGGPRRVRGAWCRVGGEAIEAFLARHVVLATGGIGRLYLRSTNPASVAGDGLALAQMAGATLSDLEFVQFHPTALALPDAFDAPLPLLTEALRGAGAILLNARGERFMPNYHAAAELAPRDVVARAVFAESLSGPVTLDARSAVGDAFPQRFPTVFCLLAEHGIDPRATAVPVTPAQHYHMGGVAVDELGATRVPGLYAVGEVAGSGVHGANRLASNSLLEGLVFGRELGEALARHRIGLPWEEPGPAPVLEIAAENSAGERRLRSIMWRQVGLHRDAAGLRAAIWELQDLVRDGDPVLARRARVCADIARAALARRESIGAHYRSDDALRGRIAR